MNWTTPILNMNETSQTSYYLKEKENNSSVSTFTSKSYNTYNHVSKS